MDVAVFGKLPSLPDFFRFGHPNGAMREAERWLLESYEALRGEDLDLPNKAVHFVLAHPMWPEVVVALAVVSRDSVGRNFPIAAFTSIDAGLVAARGWLLPVVYERFLEAAEAALLQAANDGDAQQLVAEVEQLPPIDLSMIRVAETLYDNMIHAHASQDFESRVFASADTRFYAYRTLTIACDKVRGIFPDQPGTVVGCPAVHYTDLVVWAAMVARALGWSVALPMVWFKEPTPSLLLSLGFPPAQSLRFLVDSEADSVRYWPLTTQHEGALASAREALESVAAWDREDETLDELFRRVASLA